MAIQLNYELQAMYGQNSQWWTVLAAEAGSFATRDSIDYMNSGNSGLIIEVILAAKAGTVTFQPILKTRDDAGNAITLVAFTALSANGAGLYLIQPGADKTATIKNSFTEMGTSPVPRNWFFELLYSGAGDGNEFNTEVHACYVK